MVDFYDSYFLNYLYVNRTKIVKENFSCFNYIKEDAAAIKRTAVGAAQDVAQAAVKRSIKQAMKDNAARLAKSAARKANRAAAKMGAIAKKNPKKAMAAATVGGVMATGGIVAAVEGKSFADAVDDVGEGLGDALVIVASPIATTVGAVGKGAVGAAGKIIEKTAEGAGFSLGGMLGGMFSMGGNMMMYVIIIGIGYMFMKGGGGRAKFEDV